MGQRARRAAALARSFASPTPNPPFPCHPRSHSCDAITTPTRRRPCPWHRSLRAGNKAFCEGGGNDEVDGVGVEEESTVNEIMYARGGPRARGADLTFARKCSRVGKEEEKERERERDGFPACSLNLELSRGFIAEGGPIVEIKGPRKS